jgi:hypothetical protein
VPRSAPSNARDARFSNTPELGHGHDEPAGGRGTAGLGHGMRWLVDLDDGDDVAIDTVDAAGGGAQSPDGPSQGQS